jgi:hypothetical protein
MAPSGWPIRLAGIILILVLLPSVNGALANASPHAVPHASPHPPPAQAPSPPPPSAWSSAWFSSASAWFFSAWFSFVDWYLLRFWNLFPNVSPYQKP